jgi:glucose-1-phosphate adenylyltransferase
MNLKDINPHLNLYNDEWAIWRSKHYKNSPPSKPVFSEGIDEAWFDELERNSRRVSGFYKSLIATGTISSGNTLDSVIGANVRIHSYSRVINSVIFDEVDVGRHARIKNAIIDKNVEIPEYTRIGYNKEEDLARGFTVSPSGITVVEKGYVFK